MTYKTRRIAALVALTLLLTGAFSLGGDSVAFSQAGHAVNWTLARLKAMIVGTADGEPEAETPIPLANAGEDVSNPDLKAITCAARFFVVAPDKQDVWRSLREQGIELIQASTDPEVYYAALSREQAESFDVTVALRCLCAPRITVGEGQSGTMAITEAGRGVALAWLPALSSDGKEVQSTISLHDGYKGFEIPNVGTEAGGMILIRAKGITATGEEILILLRVSYDK